MNYWLLKTEPGAYSWADLERKGTAAWDGVANPAALKNLRAMRPGDLALIYHTGKERAAVGIAEIVKAAYASPTDKTGKLIAVDLKAREKLKRPVTLDEIKAEAGGEGGGGAFEGWDLIRLGRLSVVPTPAKAWKRVLALAASKG